MPTYVSGAKPTQSHFYQAKTPSHFRMDDLPRSQQPAPYSPPLGNPINILDSNDTHLVLGSLLGEQLDSPTMYFLRSKLQNFSSKLTSLSCSIDDLSHPQWKGNIPTHELRDFAWLKLAVDGAIEAGHADLDTWDKLPKGFVGRGSLIAATKAKMQEISRTAQTLNNAQNAMGPNALATLTNLLFLMPKPIVRRTGRCVGTIPFIVPDDWIPGSPYQLRNLFPPPDASKTPFDTIVVMPKVPLPAFNTTFPRVTTNHIEHLERIVADCAFVSQACFGNRILRIGEAASDALQIYFQILRDRTDLIAFDHNIHSYAVPVESGVAPVPIQVLLAANTNATTQVKFQMTALVAVARFFLKFEALLWIDHQLAQVNDNKIPLPFFDFSGKGFRALCMGTPNVCRILSSDSTESHTRKGTVRGSILILDPPSFSFHAGLVICTSSSLGNLAPFCTPTLTFFRTKTVPQLPPTHDFRPVDPRPSCCPLSVNPASVTEIPESLDLDTAPVDDGCNLLNLEDIVIDDNFSLDLNTQNQEKPQSPAPSPPQQALGSETDHAGGLKRSRSLFDLANSAQQLPSPTSTPVVSPTPMLPLSSPPLLCRTDNPEDLVIANNDGPSSPQLFSPKCVKRQKQCVPLGKGPRRSRCAPIPESEDEPVAASDDVISIIGNTMSL